MLFSIRAVARPDFDTWLATARGRRSHSRDGFAVTGDEGHDVRIDRAQALGSPAVSGSSALTARRPASWDVLEWLSTTDHKQIGILYIVTSLLFFAIAGVFALLMRAQLAQPGSQFVDEETYNQLFTMHGTLMMLFFATPIVSGFANFLVPLQIGAADMAFPRLNALSYWLFVFGGIIVLLGFGTTAARPRAAGRATPR